MRSTGEPESLTFRAETSLLAEHYAPTHPQWDLLVDARKPTECRTQRGVPSCEECPSREVCTVWRLGASAEQELLRLTRKAPP